MTNEDVIPGAKVMAARPLPYGVLIDGVWRGDVSEVRPGTHGTVLEVGQYSTTVKFEGHKEAWRCATRDVGFALNALETNGPATCAVCAGIVGQIGSGLTCLECGRGLNRASANEREDVLTEQW